MKNSSIFIASSSRAKELALQIFYILNGMGKVDCNLWTVDTFHGGTNILESLIEARKRSDFAAVLLTKDDTIIRTQDEYLLKAPRDNCIFEVGFFIGALGLDPKRCFLITSVDEKALPSDLKGYIYYKIQEPHDLTNAKECEEVVKSVCIEMHRRISDIDRLSRIPEDFNITIFETEELMDLESVEINLKRDSDVIVHSSQPLETDYKYAQRVFKNIRNGINYHYCFDTEFEPLATIKLIAQIIRMLSLCEITDDKGKIEMLDDQELLDVMKRNHTIIEKNLEIMKNQLYINFIPHLAAETFCIHNAGMQSYEMCYLRWSRKYFVRLEDQAIIKRKAYEPFCHKDMNRVFASNKFVQISEIDKSYKIFEVIKSKFPSSLHKKLEEVCVGKQ